MNVSAEDPNRPLAADPIDVVLRAAEKIPHTDYIVGRGTRKADGGVEITQYQVSPGLGDAFVRAYKDVEPFDSAAQQFLCAPFLPIAIEVGSAFYVDDSSRQSSEMTAYLRSFYVNSLLVVGLESSMGLGWMTLYRRRQPGQPFSAQEAELASYRVRAALFEWQILTNSPVSTAAQLDRYKLLPLGRRGLDVAVRRMRGIPRKRIADELGMTQDAVDGHIRRLRQLKLSSQKLMEQFFGALPPPRPLSPDDPEAHNET